MEEKPRQRRRFQFSLRTLLILTTVCAVAFAWWSHKARQQRQAVAAIVAVGGSVAYDFQVLGLDSPPYWPKWLVDALGVDFFANVKAAGLKGTRVTDASLESLKRLTALKTLYLIDTQATDVGIARLQNALPNCDIQP